MKKFICILGIVILLIGVYKFARTNVVEPSFTVSRGDSLGVYRFASTENFKTKDGTLAMTLSYVQFGENDSFYQMRLSTKDEPYYGHIFFDKYGAQKGTFSSSIENTPITFCVDKDDNAYLINQNDTIHLYQKL